MVEDVRRLRYAKLVRKLDFVKVYDCVNWVFLEKFLERKGFIDKWRRWIMGFLSSDSLTILINGKAIGCLYWQHG